MTEDAAQDSPDGWLPPHAPGAAPPRRWQTVQDLPPASEPSGYSVPALGASPPPPASIPPPPASGPAPAPPSGPATAVPAGDWWREQSQGVPAYGAAATAREQVNGYAKAAMVLGVTGIVVCFLGFGALFFVNLPCSVLAWVLGREGVRRVDRGERRDRRGMAQTGMILGIIGTVVGGLAIVGWILGFALSEELRDEFSREWERRRNG